MGGDLEEVPSIERARTIKAKKDSAFRAPLRVTKSWGRPLVSANAVFQGSAIH